MHALKGSTGSDIIHIKNYNGLTSTGWKVGRMTIGQWEEAGAMLVKIDQARQWWLGDWYNACRWGDAEKTCDRLGINYKVASNCGAVSKRFQFPRRRGNLSFRHHAEVCYLEDSKIQDQFLDWAEENNASVWEIRQRVQRFRKSSEPRQSLISAPTTEGEDVSDPQDQDDLPVMDYKAETPDPPAQEDASTSQWTQSEIDRWEENENGMTIVANRNLDLNLIAKAKTQGKYVYVGRGQFGNLGWGNPFELPSDGTRDEVCDAYIRYFADKKSLQRKIHTLKGKVLVCSCHPKRCHGDYLAKLANELKEEQT